MVLRDSKQEQWLMPRWFHADPAKLLGSTEVCSDPATVPEWLRGKPVRPIKHGSID